MSLIFLDDKNGYVLDQEVLIDMPLKDYSMEFANGVRAPIDEGFSEVNLEVLDELHAIIEDDQVSVKAFQFLVRQFIGLRAALDQTAVLQCIAQQDP